MENNNAQRQRNTPNRVDKAALLIAVLALIVSIVVAVDNLQNSHREWNESLQVDAEAWNNCQLGFAVSTRNQTEAVFDAQELNRNLHNYIYNESISLFDSFIVPFRYIDVSITNRKPFPVFIKDIVFYEATDTKTQKLISNAWLAEIYGGNSELSLRDYHHLSSWPLPIEDTKLEGADSIKFHYQYFLPFEDNDFNIFFKEYLSRHIEEIDENTKTANDFWAVRQESNYVVNHTLDELFNKAVEEYFGLSVGAFAKCSVAILTTYDNVFWSNSAPKE